MPDQRRGGEGGRHRRREVPVERAGKLRAEEVLHDVGRVGADHDQLAVRHVDDAHEAVGDREPERREQQDRAQAHAREERGPRAARARAALDLCRLVPRRARTSASGSRMPPSFSASGRSSVLVLGLLEARELLHGRQGATALSALRSSRPAAISASDGA